MKTLQEHARFPSQVEQVSSLQDAQKKIKERSYHVFLVEQDLHDKKGKSFFQVLGNLTPKIPVVLILSSSEDEKLIECARASGISDLIFTDHLDFENLPEQLIHCREEYLKTNGGKRKASRKNGSNGKKHRSQNADERRSRKRPDPKQWIRDQLTGVYSHSFLHERLDHHFRDAKQYEFPLSCVMLDVDYFKAINSKWGYQIGDNLIKQCANAIYEHCRLSDIIARYSGEEFAILMPYADYQGAKKLADRLRSLFAEKIFFPEDQKVQITVSVGIASYPEDNFEKCTDLLRAAHQALFRAKAMGRNSVILHKEILPVIGWDIPELKIEEGKIVEFQRRMSEVATIARQAYIDASRTLIMALEIKDPFTVGHATRCAKYCRQVAQVMGLNIEDSELIEHAALLHDIGKICIPDEILLKPGRLTFEEFESMKQHPYLGYRILKPIKFLQKESTLVLHHHEWFNGEGYPCRLKRREIPFGSRIISVIDAFDTMCTAGGRYRKTVKVQDAVRELINCAGVQFDPEIVRAFITVLANTGELKDFEFDEQHLISLMEDSRREAA